MLSGARAQLAPWAARLLDEFDQADERAAAVAQSLTEEQLNWRRSPAEWSVGQCLEHLAAGNELYLRPMADALNTRSARGGPVLDIAPGWFGRWFIRNYIEPSETTKRARAPRKIVPSNHVDRSVVERFVRSNTDLRVLVRRASDYDVNRIRFTNPFVPLIRFTIGTGLLLLSAHERRHLLQADRIKSAMPQYQLPAI
jgi:hypothetical protein